MRIMAVSGGKGGVGKTTISVNLAVSFAKMKKKVLLFDADLGLANVDVVLGLRPEKNINDVLSGACGLSEVCMDGPYGLKVVPASSGVQKMSELTVDDSIKLIQSFSDLSDEVDVMIVDLASGISNQVLDMTHASQDILIVICNDPSSLTDSYAVIKLLHQKFSRSRFGIIVNKVSGVHEGYQVFTSFQQAISKFINVSMQYLGHIPQDDYVTMAARERVALVHKYPQAASSLQFEHICQGINHWNEDSKVIGGIHFFFERLIQNQARQKESLCTV